MADFIRKNKIQILAILYTAALFLLNFIRIFDNNFWGDEAYTIRLTRMSIPDMLAETAADVHPPLYYMLVKLVSSILGYRGAVFHLTSLIPYGITLILAITVLWKRYGKVTSLVFITLASILPNAVQYNVEVRMYSWGALFVLLSYLFLRQILSRARAADYVGFVLFSLAAAYSHYYCLISIAFFYVTLIVVALFKHEILLRKILICCIAAVMGYLPWFFTLLQTFERTTDDFWMMWIPTIEECIGFLFSGSCQYLLFAILMGSMAAFFLQQLYASKTTAAAKVSNELSVRLFGFFLSVDAIWVAAGAFSFFGTALVGIIVSKLIRPLFIVRYLYPVSIVAWLMLGFCVSKLKGRRVYAVIVLVLIFISGVPRYRDTYLSERAENVRMQETLDSTVSYMDSDDIILTSLAQIDWTISDYYYPGVPHQLISPEELPALATGKEYWIILETPLPESISSRLSSQEYAWEELVSDGILGTSTVFIYRAYPD